MNIAFRTAITLVIFATKLAYCGVLQTSSRNNFEKYNPSGAAVFSMEVAEIWHGVILQSKIKTFTVDGKPVEQKALHLSYDATLNKFCITHKKQVYSVEISDDNLTRIASWVNNRGTGLFTENDLLSNEQARSAGIVPLDWIHFIAEEFYGSALTKRIQYLDYPDPRLLTTLSSSDSRRIKHNGKSLPVADDKSLDWLVTDIDSEFTVNLIDGKIEIKGTVYRYHRSLSSDTDRVYITKIDQFRDDKIENLISSPLKVDNDDKKFAMRPLESAAVLHLQAIEFSKMVALLRTFYSDNQAAWKELSADLFSAAAQ